MRMMRIRPALLRATVLDHVRLSSDNLPLPAEQWLRVDGPVPAHCCDHLNEPGHCRPRHSIARTFRHLETDVATSTSSERSQGQ